MGSYWRGYLAILYQAKKNHISISKLINEAGGIVTNKKITNEMFDSVEALSNKHLALFIMMNQWVKVKQDGKSLASYFEKYGYNNIAVYGMGYAGRTLVHELSDSQINIAYAIDEKADNVDSDIKVVSPEEPLEKVDAIVITPITFFDEISYRLRDKTSCPMLSLEDILHEM